MEYILIDKSLGVRGELGFTKEAFFSLSPDTDVIQIGDGRETGCYRTDLFVQPFKYVGSFIGREASKYYAFQIPIIMLPANSEPHYLLYETTGSEALRRTKSHIRFFSPVFKTI